MNATDELRRMLDDRGVKWKPKRGRKHDGTEWHDRFGTHVEAVQEYTWDGTEQPDGKLRIERGASYLTPAQAVEATLGAGTCSIVARYMDWYCTGCGEMVGTCDVTHELHIDGNAIKLWRYCPNCGRKVVDE